MHHHDRMGFEIVIYAERRTSDGWELAEAQLPADGWPTGWDVVPAPVVEHGGRNLNMILTGAASPWVGEDVTPIAELRGLPADLSRDLRRWHEAACTGQEEGLCWGFGWLGLDEILDHDWDQPVLMEALVEPRDAALFADPPGPYPRHGWQGPQHHWSSGGDGTKVQWVATHRDLAGELVDLAVPRLVELVERPGDLRLVFWTMY